LSITRGDQDPASGLANRRFDLDQLAIAHLDEIARPRASVWFLRSHLQEIIRVGILTIVTPDGSKHRLGAGNPAVAVRISDWPVVKRLALNPDLALGEAHMDGTLTVEEGDIYGLLDLCLTAGQLFVSECVRYSGGRKIT
jgi:hypothetical protein